MVDQSGVIVAMFFIFVVGVIMVNVINSVIKMMKISNSPVETVDATLTDKRISYYNGLFLGHTRDQEMNYESLYVTFEFESGDRIELSIGANDYGLLSKDDFGKLTFQSTKFISFERIKN